MGQACFRLEKAACGDVRRIKHVATAHSKVYSSYSDCSLARDSLATVILRHEQDSLNVNLAPYTAPAMADQASGTEQDPTLVSWEDLVHRRGTFSQKDGGWKLIARFDQMAENGTVVELLCRPRQGNKSGLKEYLAYAHLPCDADRFWAVQIDWKYRPQWDEYCEELTEVVRRAQDTIMYWRVCLPRPAGRREYVYSSHAVLHAATSRSGSPVRGVVNQCISACEAEHVRARQNGIVRIQDYFATWAVWKAQGEGHESATECALLYFEDPLTSVPAWLVTQATKASLTSSFHQLAKSANQYPPGLLQDFWMRVGEGECASSNWSTGDDQTECQFFDIDSEVFLTPSDVFCTPAELEGEFTREELCAMHMCAMRGVSPARRRSLCRQSSKRVRQSIVAAAFLVLVLAACFRYQQVLKTDAADMQIIDAEAPATAVRLSFCHFSHSISSIRRAVFLARTQTTRVIGKSGARCHQSKHGYMDLALC